MAIEATRTYVGSIQNHWLVCDGLDSLGDSASKIWNVARWTANRIWDETGEIPDEGTLKAYVKNQSCWKDLNAQSSQKVIEELPDAFQSWFDLRHKLDQANPPGYRKHGDTRLKSTVTFKPDGFNYDPENNRVRLSKGKNLKDHRSDFLLCESQTRPDVDLLEVNKLQNVRAVWNGDEWDTSKTCSRCGDGTEANRVERGLYVCSSCEMVANVDCNGAENMRQKITPSPHGEDRSNGCVAQQSTYLFDRESGTFTTREQVVS